MFRSTVFAVLLIWILLWSLALQSVARTLEIAESDSSLKSNSLISEYENVTTHEGDLVIDGTQTFVIENCTYIQTGNILVEDQATIVLRDCGLTLNQSKENEFSMRVSGLGTLNSENVTIFSDNDFQQWFSDQSTVQARARGVPQTATY